MGIVFNPFTGQLDIKGSGGGGGGSTNYQTEQFILTAPQAAAKQVTLAIAPTTPVYTVLEVRGGGGQYYSLDFTVSGSTLSWNGLGLDGFLDTGDEITVIHD